MAEKYYQPEMAYFEQEKCQIHSFEVFHNKKLCELVAGEFKVIEYRNEDIEDHSYLDSFNKTAEVEIKIIVSTHGEITIKTTAEKI